MPGYSTILLRIKIAQKSDNFLAPIFFSEMLRTLMKMQKTKRHEAAVKLIATTKSNPQKMIDRRKHSHNKS
ncbi:CLUMA_CG014801, isoform A [Clunio marinus]|uniref:CLUMA_CG014801, isoform A n=1 Tax=Clunio marinus TaxID=568069 RepID=A0A1J1IQC0_9DIPT|nr:CLUMA_CG014801, isoform A [Clunio marinus]